MALLPLHMLGLGLLGQGGITAAPGDLGLEDPEGQWMYQADPYEGYTEGEGDDLTQGTYIPPPTPAPVYPGLMGGSPYGVGPPFKEGPQDDYAPEDSPYQQPTDVSRGTFDPNPWQLALIAAGSKLLEGSGWSRYPISTGQALGGAGMAGVGMYQQAKAQQDRSALMREQMGAMREGRAAQAEAARARAAKTKIDIETAELRRRLVENYKSAQAVANGARTEQDKAKALQQADLAVKQMILLSNDPEKAIDMLKQQQHPFTKETGLDPTDPKNAQTYDNWLKKQTQFAPPANFNILPEDKAKTVLAGETAKNISAFQEQAINAMRGAADFQAITDILGDYEGGVIDEWKAALGQYIPTDELKNITSANQLANSIRLRASNAFRMPGSVSNYEAQTYISAVPGMIWYREGRELASSYARKLADRMAVLTDFMQEEVRNRGYVSQKALNEFDKSLGSVFTEEERAIIRKYQGKKPPVQAAASQGVPPWQRVK